MTALNLKIDVSAVRKAQKNSGFDPSIFAKIKQPTIQECQNFQRNAPIIGKNVLYTNDRLERALNQIEENQVLHAYDNGVFVTTNEIGCKRVFDQASRAPKIGDTAVIVSGFQGLDFVAKRIEYIQRVIVLDTSLSVQKFWDLTSRTILTSNCRYEFIRNLCLSLLKKASDYWGVYERHGRGSAKSHAEKACRSIVGLTRDEDSWLGSEESYFFIKNIFSTKGFFFKRLSLASKEQISLLCMALLKETGISVDFVYHSNIRYILSRIDLVNYDNNISQLLSLNHVKVSAHSICCKDSLRLQHFEEGKLKTVNQQNLALFLILETFNFPRGLVLDYLFGEELPVQVSPLDKAMELSNGLSFTERTLSKPDSSMQFMSFISDFPKVEACEISPPQKQSSVKLRPLKKQKRN